MFTSNFLSAIKIILILFFILPAKALSQNATEIVKKADELMRAKSSYTELTMKIIKPNWTREMSMKVWALEPDYALIFITSPARDKGTVTLKRKNEVWNWLPSAQKVIKIPPSMMLQSWMGSDFTNDDLVRESSIINDYTHKIIGEEKIDGYDCYKIQLTPKPEAGVVWSKIITWIAKDLYLQPLTEYYDEDNKIVKRFEGSDLKTMDGRKIFTHWEMIPLDKPGNKTVMDYTKIQFNIKIDDSFFSEQNMKKVR
ncbi:outer membrane lipoprotein-sorting protein [Ignavibacterium sp.]|uniref:outer membrane lipoprotein-sorting protein n=1 Tax=Ignavibacterium sp. TaxID=2651167 RepID=UPI0022066451|nr:outer membrane lipoprotein-sorting protein [Ignavibacterium sp.]BDQ03364.1 MAG: outer membrane lipoprotein-sorting protein [Ignavibacterium sp.]